MARKNRIPFRREMDNLTTIDDELDKAIAELDGANGRINELLQTMEPPMPPAEPGGNAGEQGHTAESPSAEGGGEPQAQPT